MSAVSLLLPRALPAAASSFASSTAAARRLRASPLLRTTTRVRARAASAATSAAMEPVKFGPDNAIPGYVTGPAGAPGVIMMQE
jgi:hypothetical protein